MAVSTINRRYARSPSSPDRISRADSRPASPSSLSPSNAKRKSVFLGFQLSGLVLSLERTVSSVNARNMRSAFRQLRHASRVRKSIKAMAKLLQRKLLNTKFKCFCLLHDCGCESFNTSETRTGVKTPLVLPLGSKLSPAILPSFLNEKGSNGSNRRYAGVGKITGIVLAVDRFHKMSFFNILRGRKIDTLQYLLEIYARVSIQRDELLEQRADKQDTGVS